MTTENPLKKPLQKKPSFSRNSILGESSVFPPTPTLKERADTARNAVEAMQKSETLIQGPRSINHKIRTRGPIAVDLLGDTHFGSPESDMKAIDRLVTGVKSNKRKVAAFLGDIIEGFDPSKASTIRTPLDINGQINLARDNMVEPLAGKTIASVSEHGAHDGWSWKQALINNWERIVEGTGTKTLAQGGRVNLNWPNKASATLELWHKERGSSVVEPSRPLANRAVSTDHRVRADLYAAAHRHRTGALKFLRAGAEKTKPVVSVRIGTAKGSNPDLPRDGYGQIMGFDYADPLGQGAIFRPTNGSETKKIEVYPYMTPREGEVLLSAFELLDSADRQQMRKEWLEVILDKYEAKPVVNINLRSSSRAENVTPEGSDESIRRNSLAKQYERVVTEIVTKLPVSLLPIQDVRAGTTYSGMAELKRYFTENLVNDPHAVAILLRALVDPDLGKSDKREAVINDLIGTIKPVQGQVLALLLDECLRSGDWLKDRKSKGEVISEGFAAGTRLSRRTQTPLIHDLSVVELKIGPKGNAASYEIVVVDNEEDYASNASPTHGLVQMYRYRVEEKPDVMIGGTRKDAGFGRFYDRSNIRTNFPAVVAPGHFALFASDPSRSKGNVDLGAHPGQGVVFMPMPIDGSHLFYPTSHEQETRDTKDALTLLVGLSALGLVADVTKRKSSSKR
jgi:hypothetical protein